MYRIIEGIFFWEKGKHCKTAYESEVKRRQYPSSFRKKEIEWLQKEHTDKASKVQLNLNKRHYLLQVKSGYFYLILNKF